MTLYLLLINCTMLLKDCRTTWSMLYVETVLRSNVILCYHPRVAYIKHIFKVFHFTYRCVPPHLHVFCRCSTLLTTILDIDLTDIVTKSHFYSLCSSYFPCSCSLVSSSSSSFSSSFVLLLFFFFVLLLLLTI